MRAQLPRQWCDPTRDDRKAQSPSSPAAQPFPHETVLVECRPGGPAAGTATETPQQSMPGIPGGNITPELQEINQIFDEFMSKLQIVNRSSLDAFL